MSDTLISLELDVAYDDTLEQQLFDLALDLESITYRVVEPNGPGGGWPVVRFAGSEGDIRSLVARYSPDDDEHARELLSGL